MKSVKQAAIVLSLCVAMAGGQCMGVNAAEASESIQEETVPETVTEVEYDMEKGGTQTFVVEDADGEESEIVIEEMPGTARVASGEYKIRRTKTGLWKAGFIIKVQTNRITKLYGEFCNPIRGSVSKISLKKVSDAEGVLSFGYHLAGNNKKSGIKAKILNNKIIASVF